ncbi:unnamed protein product [Microthlaspi erraticum]|uniref:Uncharacterized protein n=1 Tax=Microthlaspi erraticum TaxID=1685480 RepID=A0A6D2JBV8_9BRAS|nr:unnamed protein product [Microthlaspi erraticum]
MLMLHVFLMSLHRRYSQANPEDALLGYTDVHCSLPLRTDCRLERWQPTRKPSDMLLFSMERYAIVSLGLRRWDVSQQVTTLNWLEGWFDNKRESVPELALCNFRNDKFFINCAIQKSKL